MRPRCPKCESEDVPLPCPWCGEVPELLTAFGIPSVHGYECVNSKCHIQPASRMSLTPEAALAAWNTRK